MQTVWAAAANNLKPVLYLAAVVEPDKNDLKANLLLDKIFDAEIHIVSLKENEPFIDAEKRSFALGAEHIKRLEAGGHKCMNIPMGGTGRELKPSSLHIKDRRQHFCPSRDQYSGIYAPKNCAYRFMTGISQYANPQAEPEDHY